MIDTIKFRRLDGSVFAEVPDTVGYAETTLERHKAAFESWYTKNPTASLRGVQLSRLDLSGMDLSHAPLSHSMLTGARLVGVNLAHADLEYVELVGVDLRNADLNATSLHGANLRYADLRGVHLGNADLGRAELTHARVDGAFVRGDELLAHLGSVNRDDGYTFHAFRLKDGETKVLAGCRWFTFEAYREHILLSYPGTYVATETLGILDYLEERAHQYDVKTKQLEASRPMWEMQDDPA